MKVSSIPSVLVSAAAVRALCDQPLTILNVPTRPAMGSKKVAMDMCLFAASETAFPRITQ